MRVHRLISLVVACVLLTLGSATAAFAQTDYSDIPLVGSSATVNADGTLTATIQLDALYAPGTEVTLTSSSGGSVTVVVPADGVVTVTLPAGTAGKSLTAVGTSADGGTVEGTTILNVVASDTVSTLSSSATTVGGQLQAVLTLGDGFVPGSMVTLSSAAKGDVMFTVPADRMITLNLPSSFAGDVTLTGTNAAGGTVTATDTFVKTGGPIVATAVPATAVPATAVPATAVPATAVPATAVPNVVLGTTVTATNAGFTNGVPTQPAMAVTGSNTRTPVLLGVSLLGAGGLALFAARRRQLSA